MSPPTRVIGFLFATILQAGTLSGCQALDRWAFFAENHLLGTNGPAINGIHLRQDGDNLVLRSASVVRGGLRIEGKPYWVSLHSLTANIQLSALQQDQQQIESFLALKQSGCDSAGDLLGRDIHTALEVYWRLLGTGPVPNVALQLTGPETGVADYTESRSLRLEGLTLFISYPLPKAQSCPWVKSWSATLAMLVVHELVHVGVYRLHGSGAPRLPNEVAAYMSEQCTLLALRGKVPARLVLGPEGTNSDSRAEVLEWNQTGRISTTLAGAFLSDRIRRLAFGDRALTEPDRPALEHLCRWLIHRLPDPLTAPETLSPGH